MLGNDIVDLALADKQSDWRRKNYLRKIFNQEEQALISMAGNQSEMVWLLWSMKEAAYKVVNRILGLRSFNPLSFSTEMLKQDKRINGFVKYNGLSIQCDSVVNQQFIYTQALLSEFSLHQFQTFHLPYTSTYLPDFNDAHPALKLYKNAEGLPMMIDEKHEKHYLATITHHGKFLSVAYAPDLF